MNEELLQFKPVTLFVFQGEIIVNFWCLFCKSLFCYFLWIQVNWNYQFFVSLSLRSQKLFLKLIAYVMVSDGVHTGRQKNKCSECSWSVSVWTWMTLIKKYQNFFFNKLLCVFTVYWLLSSLKLCLCQNSLDGKYSAGQLASCFKFGYLNLEK